MKGIDPSLGPSLTHPDFRGRDGDDLNGKVDEGNSTPVISVSPFSGHSLNLASGLTALGSFRDLLKSLAEADRIFTFAL